MNDLSYSSKDAVKDKIINKKSSKNKKIIFFSLIGLGSLTVAVSLPFGFLNDFRVKEIVIPPPPPPVINVDYDATNILKTDVSFAAYWAYAWRETYLSDININLVRLIPGKPVEVNSITLGTLSKIGIVPVGDDWKTWEKITSTPILKSSTSFNISIYRSRGETITYNVPSQPTSGGINVGVLPSPFYDAEKLLLENPTFAIYSAVAYKNISDFYITLDNSSGRPEMFIDPKNLEKIGIVSFNDSYKTWESIKLFPNNANEVGVSIKTLSSTTATPYKFNLKTSPSTIYDVNRTVQDNADFIMYLPYNWEKLYPVEASLTLTHNSPSIDTVINLNNLEKIGIIPKNLNYKTWTTIVISPTKSATASIKISGANDAVVANFESNSFKTSGTYDTNVILYTSKTDQFNFIWYRPKTWTTSLLPNDVIIDFNNSNITLERLESIGIVPLNNSYKSWSSITKTNITHGLQGKFSLTMSHSGGGNQIQFDVSGFKKSAIYDPFQILYNTNDYIVFQPEAFKRISDNDYNINYSFIRWTNSDVNPANYITISNLEKLGIVPLNDNYKRWTLVTSAGNITLPGDIKQVHFTIDTPGQSQIILKYLLNTSQG